MPISIKSLATGQLAATKTAIYTCPSLTTAIVRLMKFVNVSGTGTTLGINVYIKQSGGTSRRIFPATLVLPFGYEVQEDGVITLSAGDVIEADATAANEVDFSVFGIERT